MTTSVRDGERGSVTILLAFSMTIFFALAALAVDIGFLYLAQRRAQAVADLAVLAAASKYTVASQTAATNAATTIETTNGYPSTAPTYPSTYKVKVVMTLPATQLVFGKVFGTASKAVTVTSVASAGNPVPAIWSGGGCGSLTGLQMNGGPFTINGSLVSYGPLNFFTGLGTPPGPINPTVTGDLTNDSACMSPPTQGTAIVSGSVGSELATALPPDPFGYNIMTDFPACTDGSLSANLPGYNVPMVGGLIAPGVYCNMGSVNLSSGSTITGTAVTVLATGPIMVSGPGLDITGTAAGAHNIAFFSTASTPDCTTQAINLGFPGGELDGDVYAPNGCFQISGGSYTLNGSIAAKEVQYGAGTNWTINADTTAGGGKIGLYQ